MSGHQQSIHKMIRYGLEKSFAGSFCYTNFHFSEPLHVFYIGTAMYGRGMQTGWPGVRTSIAAGFAETFQTGTEAHLANCTVGTACLSQG